MGNVIERQVRFRELLGNISAQSHGVLEGVLSRINVHILEMEDVLFHHNSAVMMPENPQGDSSADGSEDDAEDAGDAQVSQAQAAMSGLKALALVFRELQFDERKKIILAAHTDTSGDVTYNFELSEMRAQNVLYLLTGEKDNWTAVCYGKQKVEDYQQVLTWVFTSRRWPCNPQGIDNSWGPNTEHATENFINYYNTEYARPNGLDEFENPSALMRTIRNDGQKRWPEELWGAVFELYGEEMAKALSMPRAQFEELRQGMGASPGGKFLYETKKYVACGESFPIDDAEKSNYRSQSNRRVEILFFDETEALAEEDFICPAERGRTHTEAECPLWNDWHFIPLYIDPNDLNAVAYHLKFRYFDRVLKAAADVPTGVTIHAYVGANEISSRQSYSGGVFTVVVQFPTNAQAQADANNVRFEFRTANQWIYTENDGATPTIVNRTPDQIAALTPVERWKYYDLPAEWSSANWRCTVNNQINDFAEHMKTRTTAGAPIIINLDDIVLTAADGSQIITDRAGTADGKDATGVIPPLSVTDNPNANPPQFASRVRILFVDPADNRLKVHYPISSGTDQAQHTSSIIRFQANAAGNAMNFIKDPPGGTRVVVFCHEFYDVTAKRTVHTDAAFDPARGHILGARRAVLTDPDVHYKKVILQTDATPVVHNPIIGDFDVHYLHGGGCDGTNQISYLVVYWCTYVTLDTNPTNGPAGGNTEAPTDGEIAKFLSTGMMNSMKHWNKKEYEFIDNAAAAAHIIRPFYFFEGNEAFKLVPPAAPAAPLDFDTVAHAATMFASAAFTTALQTARGGRPKSVLFITEEGKGSWMRSYRAANTPFTIMRVRMKTCEDDTGRFPAANLPSGAGFPFAEFGDSGQYGCLAMAHEIGHATGQVDDYTEDLRSGGHTYSCPSFSQFGQLADGSWLKDGNGDHDHTNFHQRVQSSDPYVPKHDDKTMMDKNGPIRMRHVWRFAHWLSEGGPSAGSPNKPLQGFLNDVQFKVKAPHPNPVLEYFRTDTDNVNPWSCSTSARLTVLAGPPERTMNAYLWRSLDETRRGKRAAGANAGQDVDYKAILVVRPLLSVSFVNVGANVWATGDMDDWLSVLTGYFTKVQNLLHDKFMLSGGGGDLDPTLIHFLPGFDIYPSGGAPPHNHYNYRVVVRRDNTAFSRAGDTLTLGVSNALVRELFNYLFNKPAASAAFAAADFAWIRTWFSGAGVANAAFNVVEV